jgi:hypothetical protein
MEDQFDHEFSYKVNPRALASLVDQDTERMDKPTAEREALFKTYSPHHIQYDEVDSDTTMEEDSDGSWVALSDIEAKITSGELRMYTPIKRSECKEHCLNNCKDYLADRLDSYFEDHIEFCPGCGRPITE